MEAEARKREREQHKKTGVEEATRKQKTEGERNREGKKVLIEGR